jgi:ribosomal protein L7Ae-like RNA K-turn-binding protein
MVAEALKKGTPGVVFLAADISPEIGQKFAHLAARAGATCFRFLDKERLGALIGKELRSVAAIQQSGFIETIKRELERYRNFFEGGAQSQ